MLKRLTIIVGFVAALVGSVYLGAIATNDPMMDTQDWTTSGYTLTPD